MQFLTSLMLCAFIFIHEWLDLQFKVNSERKIFLRNFSWQFHSLSELLSEILSVFCFNVQHVARTLAFMSNKPTNTLPTLHQTTVASIYFKTQLIFHAREFKISEKNNSLREIQNARKRLRVRESQRERESVCLIYAQYQFLMAMFLFLFLFLSCLLLVCLLAYGLSFILHSQSKSSQTVLLLLLMD